MSTPKLSRQEKHHMLQMYLAGVNIKEIAFAFGVHLSYPGLYARRRGVVLRQPRLKYRPKSKNNSSQVENSS